MAKNGIPALVGERAAEIFEQLHIPKHDFCLQHSEEEVAIFGGTNRLIARESADVPGVWKFTFDRGLAAPGRADRWDELHPGHKWLCTVPAEEAFTAAANIGNEEVGAGLVAEAALLSGFKMVVWRGESNGGDHTTFERRNEPGIFTSQNKEFAAEYCKPGTEPRQFFLKAEKALNLTDPGMAELAWIREWASAWESLNKPLTFSSIFPIIIHNEQKVSMAGRRGTIF